MKTATNNPNRLPSTAGKFLIITMLALGWFNAHAQTSALTGFYTQVAEADPDFGNSAVGGWNLPDGLVQNQLGPDGLPVLTTLGIDTLGTTDINPTTDELLWWSPGQGDPYVSYDSNPQEIDSMPMAFGYPATDWYPTGQSDDDSYFRTVEWEGTFNMATDGSIELDLSVDDDAWVFIDGTLVCENHYGSVTDSTTDLSAGNYSIDIFYDDRIPDFDEFDMTSSVTLTPVPEPGATTLFAAGALGLLVCGWRRQKRIAG